MNRNLCQEITGCLRVKGSAEEHLRRLRDFRPRDWETSLNWLHLSGIALVFWDRLQSLGAEDAVPPRVRAGLAANLTDHCLRIEAMRQEFDSLNHQFERAEIDYAVWKGFALIPEYCPDACLRPTYDYDYLISGDDQIRAQDMLQAAGYFQKPEQGVAHHVTFVYPSVVSQPSYRPEGLYAANLPRKVELHLRLWDEKAFRIPLRVPERPLDRKLRRTWRGISYYSLGEEDALVFQTLHTFQHILHNWCRLGWLWEIAYFLEQRSTDEPFWKRILAHLEGNDPLAELVALVLSLASTLFHATLAAPVKDQILGAMRRQLSLWVEQYGLSSALDNFSENKYTLFLYREFARDEATWRQIRRSRLLPLHRPNRVAGAASPATSNLLPASWRQGWYVVERLIHHLVNGAGFVWESARWNRFRRLGGD